MKRLPAQNWGASLLAYAPNLQNGIAAQGTKAAAYVAARSGYYVWKHWSNWETNFNNGALNTSDKPIFKIEEAILKALEQTPPELAADIYRRGLYITGGGALLRGLDKRLSNKIKLPVHVADDPLKSVVRGTGIALKNYDRYPFVMR